MMKNYLLAAVAGVMVSSVQAAPQKFSAGKVFKDCPVCPTMIVVPAGSFTMGGNLRYEQPLHAVTIAKPFAVGKFEVTTDEFKSFISEAGYASGNYAEPPYSAQGKYPAINISWDDAQAYVNWLSKKTGKSYRLPSDSEWEYATRAGSAGDFYFPEADVNKFANVFGKDDGYEFTAPVGNFPANRFGLHDVHGNVWEWTQDCWNDTYANSPADGSAWLTGNCNTRVQRGGSWYNEPAAARSPLRSYYPPAIRYSVFGLRVARTL